MTVVHVDLRTPSSDGTDVPAVGSLLCVPSRRRNDGTAVVLPAAVSVPLVAGVADVPLEPTGLDWCWRIKEVTPQGATRFVIVPDVATVNYTALVDVDPQTLDPSAEPEAAWWIALAELPTGGGGSGSGGVVDPTDPMVLLFDISDSTTAPAITLQPAALTTVNRFTLVTLTAGASGSPTPTVLWQRSLDGGATWQSAPGTNTLPTYLYTPQASTDAARFRAVFTNVAGNATSNVAVLAVNPLAPAITTQPSPVSITEGNAASFTADASGDPAPTVQWQRSTDAGATWTNIGGATSGTYVTPATALASNGHQFRAVFTNGGGTATSNAATLTVTASATTAPTIVTDPSNVSVIEGATASFTVAANGTPAPTYQWQRSINGGAFADVAGATAATYVTPATTRYAGGVSQTAYRCVVTNVAGSVTSGQASLGIDWGPEYTTHPVNSSGTVGGTVTFTQAAVGSPSPSLANRRWQVSTDGGTTWSDLTTGTSYTTPTLTLAMNGYKYRVRNGATYISDATVHSTYSNVATLTVT